MSAAGTLQPAVPGGDLADADRPAGRDRHAQGEACRLGRDRRSTWTTGDDRDRPTPSSASPAMVFLHPTAAAALRAYERARDDGVPRGGAGHVLRQQPRQAAGQPATSPHVRRARRGERASRPRPGSGAPRLHDLRHVVHGRDAAGLVPRRRGRPGPPPAPVHLARPRRPEVHLLVPLRPSRSSSPWPPPLEPAGRATAGIVTDLAPDPAGVLHRPARPAEEGQPATPSPPTATPAGSCSPSPGARPARRPASSASPTWTPPLIGGVPAAPGRPAGQRTAPPATPAWPRSTPCSSYAAPRAPEHAAVISQVLAIPPRRRERAIVSYLTAEEIDALLAAPDRATWHGRRDHALLLLAVQTGLRVSELTGLTRQDVHLGAGPHVRCHGKGRKDRATPLTSPDRQGPADLARRAQPATRTDPLFPTRARRPALPRRRRAARRQARQPPPRQPARRIKEQERHPAHAAALRRDGAAAGRRRHLGHRPLAGPRGPRKPPRSTFTPT